MGKHTRAIALLAPIVIACGGGDPGERTDAGAALDAGVSFDGGALVMPMPDIPWLGDGVPPIAIAPCPDGWREVPPSGDADVATCDPYPESGAIPDCPAGEAHFPGEPGCAPIGAPCPVGDWADGLADDGSVIFVRPGALGGDGTRALPYGTIADAMAVAIDGHTVALAKGTYDEAITMRIGVTLRGACAAQTALTASASDAVVVARVPRARLSDVSIGPSPVAGVLVTGSGASLVLDGASIAGTTGGGVLVGLSGTLDATRIVIRDLAGDSSGGAVAVRVAYSASATLRHAIVERARAAGLHAGEGSRLELSDAVVSDTQAIEGRYGSGIVVVGAAAADIARVLIVGNRQAGVLTGDASTTVSIIDSIVRGTHLSAAEPRGGVGIAVSDGAAATIERALVDENHVAGISNHGAECLIAHTVVRRTQPDASGRLGRAIEAGLAASLQLDHVVLEHNHDASLVMFGGDAVLTDVAVRDTRSAPAEGTSGRGIVGHDEAAIVLVRGVIERNHDVGVIAFASDISCTDVVVRDTLPRACAETTCAEYPSGSGVAAVAGGRITLERFVIAHSNLCGLLVEYGSHADLFSGQVVENRVGVCLGDPAYDRARLTSEVVYRDNEVTFDTGVGAPGA